MSLAFAILIEVSLRYLGLGTQPPAPSGDTMLDEGRTSDDATCSTRSSAGARSVSYTGGGEGHRRNTG